VKKFVVAGICALAVSVVAPVPVAQAAADRCTTKSEYRKIKDGMSRAQVVKLIGYRGKVMFRFAPYETRVFASCKSTGGSVLVSFEHKLVTDKSAVWG
jgi:hypothetical protein